MVQIPPHIGNLPSGDLISLYYVLWIILVQTDFVLLHIPALKQTPPQPSPNPYRVLRDGEGALCSGPKKMDKKVALLRGG